MSWEEHCGEERGELEAELARLRESLKELLPLARRQSQTDIIAASAEGRASAGHGRSASETTGEVSLRSFATA